VAVKVTLVLVLNSVRQVSPQSMPAGELVMVALPAPALAILSSAVWSCFF